MFRRSDALIGYAVHATDGEVGSVHDVYFGDDTWAVRYIVVDTGPWLLGRRVLVSPLALDRPATVEKVIRTDLTKVQIESSPDIDLRRPVSRQQEVALHDYYRWPYYWMAVPSLVGPGAAVSSIPMPEPEEQRKEAQQKRSPAGEDDGARQPDDPHLRSMNEVIGYHIHALDGEIGHVEDFLVDDGAWFIRYMLVDTRNWLPGRKVLVAPEWIERVSWNKAMVYVDVTREQIEESPEYNPGRPLNREYEARLFRHYGAPYYWP